MSKTDETEVFNAEGIAVEKALNEERTIVHHLNMLAAFFEIKSGGLKEAKVKSVADEFKEQMRARKFDRDQQALCWRLLAQSFYGVDRTYEHVDAQQPTVLLLGAFEQKNKLRYMSRFYEIMAQRGEDGDLGKRAQHMLSAVELTPDIKEYVEQIVEALPSFEAKEISIDQMVQKDNGGGGGGADDAEGFVCKLCTVVQPRKKRKASSSAEKRIAIKVADDKRKAKEMKKKIKAALKAGKDITDMDDEALDVGEEVDEKEDAQLAEVAEAESNKELASYNQVLAHFMTFIRQMMELIMLDKVFQFNVAQFMTDALKVAKADARAAKAASATATKQKAAGKRKDAAESVKPKDDNGDDDDDNGDGGDDQESGNSPRPLSVEPTPTAAKQEEAAEAVVAKAVSSDVGAVAKTEEAAAATTTTTTETQQSTVQ